MLKNIIKGLALSLVFTQFVMANSVCNQDRVTLQVLGSGGPELDDGRASSSYLIWLDGKARALVDLGSGANVNFGQANARLEDISAIMLTHLHVDHSADLPAFVKGAFFSDREEDLTVLGPEGNALMPSTSKFVSRLFGNEGAYAYLSNYFEPEQRSAFKLKTQDIALGLKAVSYYPVGEGLMLSTIPVHHGPVAAVAWRVDIAGCAVTFSGDMNNQYQTLEKLALNSDILVMHNAVPETASGVATHLHMTPSQIGRIAQKAKVKKLVISHRMNRTLGIESKTKQQIKLSYQGPILFANDLDSFKP